MGEMVSRRTITGKSEPLAKAIAPVMHDMLVKEIERIAAAQVAEKPNRAEVEIMAACRDVARAVDTLLSAKFTNREIPARRHLEKVAHDLGRAMRKHGRMPKGE